MFGLLPFIKQNHLSKSLLVHESMCKARRAFTRSLTTTTTTAAAAMFQSYVQECWNSPQTLKQRTHCTNTELRHQTTCREHAPGEKTHRHTWDRSFKQSLWLHDSCSFNEKFNLHSINYTFPFSGQIMTEAETHKHIYIQQNAAYNNTHTHTHWGLL